MIHSGLHDGGVPMKSGKQVHTAWPLDSLQTLFGPQGDGKHGFLEMTGSSTI